MTNAYSQRYDWNRIEEGIIKISNYISQRNFSPDAMICIPGGGVVLTQLFKMKTKRELLPTYILEYHKKDESRLYKEEHNTLAASGWWITIPLEALKTEYTNILIIDDFARTGETLNQLKGKLVGGSRVSTDNIMSISLVSRSGIIDENKPDHTIFEEDHHHILMPWGDISLHERMK